MYYGFWWHRCWLLGKDKATGSFTEYLSRVQWIEVNWCHLMPPGHIFMFNLSNFHASQFKSNKEESNRNYGFWPCVKSSSDVMINSLHITKWLNLLFRDSIFGTNIWTIVIPSIDTDGIMKYQFWNNMSIRWPV